MSFMAKDDHSQIFPSFFKIILEPRHDLQRLGIPKKFMTEYGSDFMDVVSLKIPTGKRWEVELLKENGRAWFKDGWSEIVKICSICHGHFLMFTYTGMSLFNLYIFDMTACEVEYPIDPQERKFPKTVSEIQTKVNPGSPNSSPKENGMLALVRQYRKKFGAVTRKDINKINSYQFENPSFVIVMHPSYVTQTGNHFRMLIPAKFAAEYFPNAQGTGTLQNAIGDTWPIKYNGSSPRFMKISWGWKEFALDNKLCVNDICVFELINAFECLFKVEIMRHSSPPSSVDVGVASPSRRVLQDLIAEVKCEGIPEKFMTEYGSDFMDVVSLKIPNGKTWGVGLWKENGRAWFKEGWSEIVNFCSICHGHFLMFTYEGKSQFKVYIFDMTACEVEYPLDPQQTEVRKTMSEIQDKANNTCSPSSSPKEHGMLDFVRQYRRKFGAITRHNIKKINSYQFKNPSFTVVMRPFYVKYKFLMNVPTKFSAEYLTNAQSCTLQNATGDTWPIKFESKRPVSKKFSWGWEKFVLDNNLRVDDICVFELINAVKCLFKVEIIRCSSQPLGVGVGVAVAGRGSSTRSPEVKTEVALIDD